MKIAVVGSGFTGMTIAFIMSRLFHFEVDLFDKRDHIGGNAQDEKDEFTGLIVPKYGAHIFHTQNKTVWDFVNRFTPFNDYVHEVKAFVDNEYFDWPINLNTLMQVFGVSSDEDALYALKWEKAPFSAASEKNFENKMLSQLGDTLYRKFVYGYTKKMWDREPSDLRVKHAGKVPIRLSHSNKYFEDDFQGMPSAGYCKLFERMLEESNVGSLFLNEEFTKEDSKHYSHIFVTSPIDEWFDYCFGRLEYRSMRFEYELRNKNGFVQRAGTINTPQMHIKMLRSEEPKHYYQQTNVEASFIVRNFAQNGDTDKYYPVPSDENERMAEKYRRKAENDYKDLTFCGRLGTYRYINMDQAILMAINACSKVLFVDVIQKIAEYANSTD